MVPRRYLGGGGGVHGRGAFLKDTTVSIYTAWVGYILFYRETLAVKPFRSMFFPHEKMYTSYIYTKYHIIRACALLGPMTRSLKEYSSIVPPAKTRLSACTVASIPARLGFVFCFHLGHLVLHAVGAHTSSRRQRAAFSPRNQRWCISCR